MNDKRDVLNEKVEQWLSKEGYPLEFLAANIMQKIGYAVRQGQYARTSDNTPREIDLVATVSKYHDERLLRVYNVVECKFSKDKPWVVFCGNNQPVGNSALVSQSIASTLGDAIMWSIAGHEEVTALKMFSCFDRYGFGGTQALANNNRDVFYNSLQSVVQNSFSCVQFYDDYPESEDEIPKYGAVAFPIILIDGKLFSAYFDAEDNTTKIEEVGHARCHWRGSPETSLHTTVDLVTIDNFEDFASKRFEEVCSLLTIMEKSRDQIELCKKEQSLDSLDFHSASRGVIGLPAILHKIECTTDKKEDEP